MKDKNKQTLEQKMVARNLLIAEANRKQVEKVIAYIIANPSPYGALPICIK
jgi:hypothetical protein